MNSKFYVPFETAKMLKAQGYPQVGSDMYYNLDGDLGAWGNHIMQCTIEHYYAAPAYCEVLDWLEESKEIYIDVNSTPQGKWGKWYCCIWTKKSKSMLDSTLSRFIREQAINEAIVGVLEEMI